MWDVTGIRDNYQLCIGQLACQADAVCSGDDVVIIAGDHQHW